MEIEKPKLIKFKSYRDNRGYFRNALSLNNGVSFLEESLPNLKDVKVSLSKKFTFRGLHLQESPFSQGKYVSVLKGDIIDLAYDVKNNEIYEFQISEFEDHIVYIPPGYAHGFFTLEESVVMYGVTDNYYEPSSEKSYSIFGIDAKNFLSKKFILKNLNYISEKDKVGR